MTAGLIAGLGGAVAILAVSASRDGGDGFELALPGRPRAVRAADARPVDRR